MKELKNYSAPVLRTVLIVTRSIFTQSVGGNTGYSGSDTIPGGDLTDGDD